MEGGSKKRIWAALNIAALLGTLIVNALANILPLNGQTTGGLSDSYPNLFVPAGLTFSIWGVIYLLLTGFAVFNWIEALKGKNESKVLDRIGPFFLISCLGNMGWIFAWHWQMPAIALFCMFVILGSLLIIYLRLAIGKEDAPFRIFTHWPFSVYLGWITVATVANVTAVLVDIGWNGFGLNPQVWTAIAIATALGLSVLMMIFRKDWVFSAVILWAFAGILLKRLNSAYPEDMAVEIAAGSGMAVILGGIVWIWIKNRKSKNS